MSSEAEKYRPRSGKQASHLQKPNNKPSSIPRKKTRRIPFRFQSTTIMILLLLSAAIIQRFAYHYEYNRVSVFAKSPVSDAAAYHELARDLAEKNLWADQRSVHHTIGYPLALSMIYKGWGPNPLAVTCIQAALGMLNILLVLAIGKLLWGTTVGVLAALLTLLYGPLLFYETKLMPTILGMTFNLGFLFCFIKWKQDCYQSIKHGTFTGLLAGGAVAIRPDAVLIIIGAMSLVALDLIRKKTSPRLSVRVKPLIAAAISLLVFPAIGSLRVYASTGKFTPLPATGGITLYSGNNPSARGTYTPYKELTGDKRHQALEARRIAARISKTPPHKLDPYETSSILTRSVFKWWLENPLKTAKLAGLKIYRFFHASEPRSSYSFTSEKTEIKSLRLAPLTFPIIAMLALFAILTRSRSPQKTGSNTAVLKIYILVHLLTGVLFFVSTRYRAPVVPVLCLFAAASVHRLIVETPSFGKKHLLIATAFIAVIFSLHANILDSPENNRFIDAFNEGIALQNIDSHEHALERFQKARKIDPLSHHAWIQEGNSLTYLGRYRDAGKAYRKAMRIKPDFYQPHFNLGVIHARLGNVSQSLSHIEKAAALAPDNPTVRLTLAQMLLKTGDTARAREEFQNTISLAKDLDPDTAAQAQKHLRNLDRHPPPSKKTGLFPTN